jgi:hypothetical protein
MAVFSVSYVCALVYDVTAVLIFYTQGMRWMLGMMEAGTSFNFSSLRLPSRQCHPDCANRQYIQGYFPVSTTICHGTSKIHPPHPHAFHLSRPPEFLPSRSHVLLRLPVLLCYYYFF